MTIEDFNSAELQAFFDESGCYDEERMGAFFLNLFMAYQPSEQGISLEEQIAKDWDFIKTGAVHQVLEEVMQLPGVSAYGLIPNSKVVYSLQVTSVINLWEQLKTEIKTDTRFFINTNRVNELGLDACFMQAISECKPENKMKYYRARLSSAEKSKFTRKEMGMPYREKATAGRANPVGIPYLYTCTSPETCFYEVRATYLDHVNIGTFKIKPNQVLRLVDLTTTYKDYDFDDDFWAISVLRNRLLFSTIGKELSTPMRRHDNTQIEYLPTQFICEYIRKNLFDAEGKHVEVDGLIFQSSVYEKGNNVVLFNMDKVECNSVHQWEVKEIAINPTKIK